jgi:hypothetical protein
MSLSAKTGGLILNPKTESVVQEILLVNGMYISLADSKSTNIQESLLKSLQKDWDVKHRRLAHESSTEMQRFFGHNVFLKPCEACCKGKFTWKSHKRRPISDSSRHPLSTIQADLVHAVIRSVNGELYYCTVVDDSTRFSSILL